MILSGLVIVYKTAADLDINRTPWPVPVQRGSLISHGIFQYMRHPMCWALIWYGRIKYTHRFSSKITIDGSPILYT